MRTRFISLLGTVSVASFLMASSAAADPVPAKDASMPNPPPVLRDPYVPPAARHPADQSPPSGDALKALVATKLRRQFELADEKHLGMITAGQARRAGLGFVDKHFDAIDTEHRGTVTFEQVQRYIQQRDDKR